MGRLYQGILSKGQLKFEGEYLNGERNGKGNEYYYDGKLIFEGEYLNGERKEGKEYNYDQELIFEGEYINGKKNKRRKTEKSKKEFIK